MRILLRPRLPVLALLLLAPSIPELLTGSTPISRLLYDPVGFGVSFGFDIGLYGTGALLIRETAQRFGKGWATVLLWGAAYGIAEEGFAVHTFFQPSGSPVGLLSVYGAAYGVNGLWALGLTVFHATYSTALPILLTNLWFPSARKIAWLDRGAITVVAVVYLAVVALFADLVGHGPSSTLLASFLLLAAALLATGYLVPGNLCRVGHGKSIVGPWTIGLAGSLEWIAWIAVLIFAGTGTVPAWMAALVLCGMNAVALGIVLRWIRSEGLERSEFQFAVGMLVPLFLWDAVVEFSVPGILLVAAVFAYLLYRLHGTIDRRTGAADAASLA